MNTDMYNLVKAAIKEGKSIEDVMAEVNLMAETANKELQPRTPLLEKYNRPATRYNIASDDEGRVDRESLISIIAVYFVQHGFNPDPCFDTEADFREHIAGILDRGLSASKTAADLAQIETEGASDDEMLKVWLKGMSSYLMEALKGYMD